MTRQQQRAMKFIIGHVRKWGFSPSYEEIAGHLELKSKAGVGRIVRALIDQDILKTDSGRARSLRPVNFTCPSCGEVFCADEMRGAA